MQSCLKTLQEFTVVEAEHLCLYFLLLVEEYSTQKQILNFNN